MGAWEGLRPLGWGVPGASPSPGDRGGTGIPQSWGHGGVSAPRGVEMVWEVGVPCPGPSSHVPVPRPICRSHSPCPCPMSHVPVPRPISLYHVPHSGPTSLFQAPHPISGCCSPPVTPSRAPSTAERGDAGDPSHRLPSRLAALNRSRGLGMWGGAPPMLQLGPLLVPWVLLAPRGWGCLGDGVELWGHRASLRPAPWHPNPTDPQPHSPRTPLAAGPATPPNPPQNPSRAPALPRAAAGTETQPGCRGSSPR